MTTTIDEFSDAPEPKLDQISLTPIADPLADKIKRMVRLLNRAKSFIDPKAVGLIKDIDTELVN